MPLSDEVGSELSPSLRSARVMAWGMVAIYALMIALHVVPAANAHAARVGLPTSIAGSVIFLVLATALQLGWKPRALNMLMGLIAVSILGNVTLNYVNAVDPSTAAMFVMFALGVGGLLMDSRWVALNLCGTWVAWAGATAFAVPHEHAIRDGLAILASLVAAAVLHVTRVRKLRSIERLRHAADARRAQAETAADLLARSQRSLRDLVELNPDGHVVVRDGTIVYANRSFCDALLYDSAAELVGSVFASLEAQPRRSSLKPPGSPADAMEHRLVRKDGADIVVEIVSRSIDWNGEPAELLVARDVTARHEELHARMLASDRLLSLGRLAAGVAHEVNNPLTYVIDHVRRIREGNGSKELLDEALDGLHRVQRVVRDLQRFTAPTRSGHSEISVAELVSGALRMVRHDLAHQATIKYVTRAHPMVRGNPAELGQVFVNLLLNAVEALGPDPGQREVSLIVDQRDDVAVVEVRDSGCGMSEALVGRIFEPFFTTKPFAEGTGLGLHYCRTIVDGLGGSIEVESAPGRGALFRVLLPRVEATASLDESHQFSLPSLRILVVDDEPLVARSIARMLRRHEVDTAEPSEAVVTDFAEGRYDVLICDLMMPTLSGPEIHERVAARSPGREQRIVFVTGGAFTSPTRAFVDGTVNPVVEKPVDPALLKSALLAVMDPAAPITKRSPDSSA